MADATAVVQAQQVVVGRSLVGSSAAVAGESPDSEKGILEQIREISLKTFRAAREQVEKFADLIQLERDKIRRDREQEAERLKEQNALKADLRNQQATSDAPANMQDDAAARKGGLFGGLLGATLVSARKLLGPVIYFFSTLVGFFGRLIAPITRMLPFLRGAGPIGLAIGAILLVFRYFDDIVKALTPALDKIKELAVAGKPLFDVLVKGFDFLIKNIIGGIGRIIAGIIEDITPLFTGISKMIEGDILGGLKMIGEGIFNVIMFIPRAIARFFEPVLADIESFVVDKFNSAVGFVKNIFTSVVDSITSVAMNVFNYVASIPGKIMSGIMSIGESIGRFFTVTIPDLLKSAINSIIDALPLPGFLKNKMKMETSKMKEEGDKISEFGVKNKYVDSDVNAMARDRAFGGKATMAEGFEEATKEGYIDSKITKSGTSGFDFASGVLTPEQYNEFSKLNDDEALQYLKNLDAKEQERRSMIMKLKQDKISHDKKIADLIAQGKALQPEFGGEIVSPDDQLLMDNRAYADIQKQKRQFLQAEVNRERAITNIINQPINQASNASNTSNTVSTTPLRTTTDPYFDRESFNQNYSA